FLLTACAQAQDYPAPVKALASKGITIKGTLPATAGLKGYIGNYQGQSMPVYLLADGKHVVIGTLFDAEGNDLTQGPLQAATAPSLDEATWTDLSKASWIAEGAIKPKRIVYVFTDTECPYCHKLWLATQPLLAGGDVQVRHIMVAVIAPQSLNRAAAILDAADPKAALHQHENTFGHSTVTPLATVSAATEKRIAANGALMDKLGIQGTPATVYKDASNKIRIAPGMLPDKRLKSIFSD
ncbi:MAG: thiol:disulfide interchange protein DsbG, partial [Rhodanobacter sp.]